MIRLPKFRYLAPKSVAEVTRILADEGPEAMVLAGGTDLFPNMKRRQQTPKVVVGLRNIPQLRERSINGREARVGPMTIISEVVRDVRWKSLEAFWSAARSISSPPLQNMGTIGGNLCLDTRCNYYDQSYEWRKAINFCMKKDGETCWVAPSSPRCWAVSSTDAAPALIALSARIKLVSAEGERTIDLKDFYADDGIRYLTKKPGELLTDIFIPSAAEWKSSYRKLRRRGSIDFPVLSVATAVKWNKGTVEDARIVLNAVTSRPVVCSEAATSLIGKKLSDDVIEEAAERAWKPARPLDNTDFAMTWRKTMVRRYVSDSLRDLRP